MAASALAALKGVSGSIIDALNGTPAVPVRSFSTSSLTAMLTNVMKLESVLLRHSESLRHAHLMWHASKSAPLAPVRLSRHLCSQMLYLHCHCYATERTDLLVSGSTDRVASICSTDRVTDGPAHA